MIQPKEKRPSGAGLTVSECVHLPPANSAHFTTLIGWYVSTSLSEEQALELENLLNKHGDKIGLTPDLAYLRQLDQETFRLLKRIDESYENGTE